jgi:hypothetical protein
LEVELQMTDDRATGLFGFPCASKTWNMSPWFNLQPSICSMLLIQITLFISVAGCINISMAWVATPDSELPPTLFFSSYIKHDSAFVRWQTSNAGDFQERHSTIAHIYSRDAALLDILVPQLKPGRCVSSRDVLSGRRASWKTPEP